ncbi:MAG TPA: DUF4870 domain-containing protein [Stenomitos sp.]
MQENNPDVRTWGMLCHLASLAGYAVPFGNIIGPLIVWQVKKEDPFVDAHGKESLNFQISVTIYFAITFTVFWFLLFSSVAISSTSGTNLVWLFPLFPFLFIIIGILVLILVVFAAIKANQGNFYHYPLTIRFFK